MKPVCIYIHATVAKYICAHLSCNIFHEFMIVGETLIIDETDRITACPSREQECLTLVVKSL